MPYRKKYNKKKRTYRKKKQFNKRSGAGIGRNFPMAKTYKFHSRYFQQIALDSGPGGLPAAQIFRLTSLFDPDYTGTGHQPLGFDQIMPMYNHYTVIGARVRVSCWNRSDIAQRVLLSTKAKAIASLDPAVEIENGDCRWVVLGGSESGSSVKTLTLNFSASKFFGRKVLQGDKYSGTEVTSPADNAYLHITAAPCLGQDLVDVRCEVLIEYIAILTEPKMLTQS